jgi:energy-converting hydrogenase A subunit M
MLDEDKELLEKMKLRIIRSFMWEKDIVTPLSNKLEISNEETEKILINSLDMSSLEALHATFESSRAKCISDKIHVDLQLCWLCDVLELITIDESNRIKKNLVKKIINGKSYNDVLKDGKKLVLELLLIDINKK